MDLLDIYIALTATTFLINTIIEYKAYLSAKKRAFKFKRFNDYFVSGRINLKHINNIFLCEMPSVIVDSIVPINNIFVLLYEINDYDYIEQKYYEEIRKQLTLIDKTEQEDRDEILKIVNEVFPDERINNINYTILDRILKNNKVTLYEDYEKDSVRREINFNKKKYVYEYKYKD